MAYHGGEGIGGLPAQRPAPSGFNDRPPPQRLHGAPQPLADNHAEPGHGHGAPGRGFGQDNRQQYHDYGQAMGQPLPRDHCAPGMADRRGPVFRPATADGYRGGQHPPRGRAMVGPDRRGASAGSHALNSDHAAARRPPASHGPSGRREPAYGTDQDLVGPMSDVSLNGQRARAHPDGSSYSDGFSRHGDYGHPPVDGSGGHYPPRASGGYDDDYGSGPNGAPPGNHFAAPARSVTVRNMQLTDTMPYNDPASRGVPVRPSTATGSRPPPRRMYTPSSQRQPQDQYGAGYGGYGHDPAPSVDDVFDSYFDNPRANSAEYGSHLQRSQADLPPFDAAPAPRRAGSFDALPVRPGLEHPQRGPFQTPRLHHAKSEANVGEPLAAVLELAGDIPSVPHIPHIKPCQPEFAKGHGEPSSYEAMPPQPLGPSATAVPMDETHPGGSSGHDGTYRTGTGLPESINPDALPCHPTPVRPGLMANSVVSLNNRPPPIRNYSAVQQTGPAHQGQQRMVMRAGQQAPETGTFDGPVTPRELEMLRVVIKSNANDQESALRLAKRLIEAADVLAPRVPDVKQRARTRERYLVDSHKILKKLSNAQNPDAMFVMADGLGKGLFGHEPDNKEAFTLYQSAAKLGHAAAAYRTAVCCEIGHEEGGGTRRDPPKATQWYKRAATLGDTPAMYKVGMIQLKGLLGQPKNPKEAIGWLKRAAERADAENPHALHELGLLYESAQPNDTIIRDERYALSLFQQAAELGYKFSQFRLGCVFEYGLMGCPIDARQSIYWYSKAATQEEHQSELALSGWYLTGSEDVLGQSDTEAYLWARKAAVAGLAKAEYAMGYLTEMGIGVAANLEDAKRWYWRATAQDFPKARDRLEDLKRAGKNGYPRQRERISRSRIEKHQEGECSVM